MTNLLSSLDTLTLQLVAFVVMLVTLGASLILWQSSAKEKYTNYWAAGYLLICVGLSVMAMRGFLPLFITIILGNTITAVGGVLIVNGIRQFCRPGQKNWSPTAVGLAIAVSFCVLTYLYPSLQIRIAIMAALFAAICLDMARQLWKHATDGIRLLQRGLSILLLLQFCYYLIGLSNALVPAAATDYPEAPAAYNAVYLNAIIIFVALLFGFTGLINRRLQLQLQHVAHHDALTGALNRRALDNIVRTRLYRSESHRILSVVVFDLDHFKQLNDTYGHQVGDTALQQFVKTAQTNLRQGDELGRTGGEEFCLILPGTDNETACAVAERLRKLVETLEVPGHQEVRLTVSAGVATATAEKPWSEIMKAADEALYLAKRNGRNRVVTLPVTPAAQSSFQPSTRSPAGVP